jgi:hypothetical protein
MAIISIEIVQDNKVGNSDLVPIHSPLIFLINATYNVSIPDYILVDIKEDSTVLSTWKCIAYKDLSTSVRQFAFIANEPVLSQMESFEDFAQLENSLEFVENITKVLELNFYDPDSIGTNDSVILTFCHGAKQFGEQPNLEAIYNNEIKIYYAEKDKFVYVYFYNADPNNVLSINTGLLIDDYARDNDSSIFSDNNDDRFKINILDENQII